jgi:1-acyl-sn-glycerol-3-phosphate acyltransferase
MLPPRVLRRLLLVPLVIVIAGALVVLAPALAALSVVFAIVRRRFGRMRMLRVVYIALIWSLGEATALAVFLCLWIISGFGGRLETEPYRSRHYGVMRRFLDLIYRAAQRACGLRVEVESPAVAADATLPAGAPGAPGGTGEEEARPVIVFSRHAGPGDSLLLVRYLLTVCGRRPRVVMKATLQLDPSLDIVANRLPNAFIKRHKSGPRPAGPRSQTEQIRRLARTLDGNGALVLFPEGANWTPLRWRRGIERLRRSGQPGLAERAAAMPNVLAPRPGGALTAIASCPEADVIFVAHTGTDRLVSVRDIWRCLSADISIRARWWRVPAADVPRAADHEAQVRWLYDWWQRIDSWITSQQPGAAPDAPGAAADAPDSAPDAAPASP